MMMYINPRFHRINDLWFDNAPLNVYLMAITIQIAISDADKLLYIEFSDQNRAKYEQQ